MVLKKSPHCCEIETRAEVELHVRARCTQTRDHVSPRWEIRWCRGEGHERAVAVAQSRLSRDGPELPCPAHHGAAQVSCPGGAFLDIQRESVAGHRDRRIRLVGTEVRADEVQERREAIASEKHRGEQQDARQNEPCARRTGLARVPMIRR